MNNIIIMNSMNYINIKKNLIFFVNRNIMNIMTISKHYAHHEQCKHYEHDEKYKYKEN